MKLQLILILCISLSFTNVFANEIGQIKFSENFYMLEDTPKITLIDSDINVNSTIHETIEIDVWSETDAGGINLILNETGIDTGIFEAYIILTTDDESRDTTLRITDGDIITGEYEDTTLPIPPYNVGDELDISALTFVSDGQPPTITVITDKTDYLESDPIIIRGSVSEIVNSNHIQIDIVYDSIEVYRRSLQLSNDGDFGITVITDGVTWESFGEYVIKVSYALQTTTTTFNIIPPPLQIFTDKPSYNEIETIQITGQINDIDVSPIDLIRLNLYDQNDNILIPESLIPIINDTFSHEIITDDIVWNDHYGDVKITAELQNYTAQTTVQYSYYPAEISLEYLHDLISNHAVIINNASSHIDIIKEQGIQHNTLIITLLESIIHLQLQIDELKGMPPIIISDAPIISSLIVDDPDDSDDIYSKDDIITITFDSDTNMPLGQGRLSKAMVDNMFTFSDSIGSVYKGTWESPDAFVITIKGIKDQMPIINATTVTPTGLIPILSIDGTSTASNATSPVLSGDFGIP